MATPIEPGGRRARDFDGTMVGDAEPLSAMSNLRVVAWLAWLTACQWLTRYNGLSRKQGT